MNNWLKSAVNNKPNEKFGELFDLWQAFQDDRSSNIDLLKHKIERIYSTYSVMEKREFTEFMISKGVLNERIIEAIRETGGHLNKLTEM